MLCHHIALPCATEGSLPTCAESLEALGTFMDASLDTIAEVMRFAAVFAASLYLRDKAAPKVKKRA